MLRLFVPVTKVQKDRQIMRDTDSRVAKYSRRGLVLNFLVFLLCLAYGDFYARETTLAVVLLTGLLLVTLLRSYYLFRFDALYARAPMRWRNQYFFASFLGAAWWSCILVSLTWTVGMRDETLLMWLYSIVFYSSVASVFAPYRRFLTIYFFIGQVPAAVTAVLIALFQGQAEGTIYGIIMLMFFLMLTHQAKNTSAAYWERLEANFALRERARGLEHKHRSSQEAIALKDEFLINLGHEFRSSLNDILGTLNQADDEELSDHQRELLAMARKAAERQLDLVNNVVDFSKITTHSLTLESAEFDLRRLLEKQIQGFAPEAHQQGVEFNYLFAQDLPQRVKGDANRLEQVLGTLFNHALKFSEKGQLFVEAEYTQDQGQLQLIISERVQSVGNTPSGQGRTQDREDQRIGIGLSICKGLAECMGGGVQLMKTPSGDNRIALQVALETVAHEDKGLGEDRKLAGKRVLLVDLPEPVALDLVNELESWGMVADTAYSFDTAMQKLDRARDREQPVELVLIYNHLHSFNGLVLSREIADSKHYAELPQVVAMSLLQRDTPEARKHLRRYPQVRCIEKPIMRRRLYKTTLKALSDPAGEANATSAEPEEEDDTPPPKSQYKVLLVEEQRVNQMVVSGMLKKLGCHVQVVGQVGEAVGIVEDNAFDLVLIDCDLTEEESLEAIGKIRAWENRVGSPRLPIVAMLGVDDEKLQARAQAAGADDQVIKPLRYRELTARLPQWVKE